MKKCNCKKSNKHKKGSKKDKKSCNPNPYSDAVVPPCAGYLENENVLLLNGELIYRNVNRLYAFISTSASNKDSKNNSTEDLDTNIEISITTFIIGLFINQVQMGLIEYDKNKPIHHDKKIDKVIHQLLENSCETSDKTKKSNHTDEKEENKEAESESKSKVSKKSGEQSDKNQETNESEEAQQEGAAQQTGNTNQSGKSQQSGTFQSPQTKYSISFFISNGDAIVYFVKYRMDITELNYFILFTINRLECEPGLYFPNNSYAVPIPANFYLSGLHIKRN